MKVIQRIFLIFTILLSLIFTGQAQASTIEFGDISTHWAEKAIQQAANMGIVAGYNGMFHPDGSVTKAQFVKILVVAAGASQADVNSVSPTALPFSDVSNTDWSFPYIEWAMQKGWIDPTLYTTGSTDPNGNPLKQFQPSIPITREEAANLLRHALLGNQTPNVDMSTIMTFKDDADLSPVYKSDVYLMKKYGLLNGDTKGYFSPKNSLSRAEACVLALAFIKEKNTLTPTSAVDWSGDWTRPSQYFNGILKISNQTSSGFDFDLNANSGANMGEIKGTATMNGNTASFVGENNCNASFALDNNVIHVNTSDGCSFYAGAGVEFDGDYQKGDVTPPSKSLVDLGVFRNQSQDDAFRALVGTDYQLFSDRFMIVSQGQDEDGLNATVYTGGVNGLYTIMEAIVMYDDQGHYWAAAIDGNLNVRYYTNDDAYKGQLPTTIQDWSSRFSSYPTLYMSNK